MIRSLSLTVFFLFCVALLSCGGRAKEEPAEAPPPVVEIIKVEYSDYRPHIDTTGVIGVTGKADVFPVSEGLITALHAEEGDAVFKGQELGKLDDTDLLMRRRELEAEADIMESRLRLARARLLDGEREVESRLKRLELDRRNLEELRRQVSEARTVYNNKKALYELGGVSERELQQLKDNLLSAENNLYQGTGRYEITSIGFRDLDILNAGFEIPVDPVRREEVLIRLNTATLRAEVDSAEAELEKVRIRLQSADLLLRKTRLRSPISGIIGARMLGLGEKAGPDTPVFTVFADGAYYAVARVSESDMDKLTPGLPARIRCCGRLECTGRLERISPYVDPESHSVEVKILIADHIPGLRPGMYAEISMFTGPTEKIIRLPRSALNDKGMIFVYDRGHVFSRKPEYRLIDGSTLAVVEGLTEGEFVCERTDGYIRDGAEVRPRQLF